MPSGSSLTVQQALDAKLRQVRTLIRESLELVAELEKPSKRSPRMAIRARTEDASVRFDMNERAFVKRYAKSVSGGQRKFVLLLAFLTKGDLGKEASLSDIEQLWNRMKSKALLGMKFNRFFPTTAKEHGWVDSKKRGFYSLERSWKQVIS